LTSTASSRPGNDCYCSVSGRWGFMIWVPRAACLPVPHWRTSRQWHPRAAATLGHWNRPGPHTPTGFHHEPNSRNDRCGIEGPTDSTPSGLTVSFRHVTQGSRCAATLGYVMEPLRGSPDGPRSGQNGQMLSSPAYPVGWHARSLRRAWDLPVDQPRPSQSLRACHPTGGRIDMAQSGNKTYFRQATAVGSQCPRQDRRTS